MRNWFGASAAGLACIAMAGCASQQAPLTEDEAMALLRSGRPVLTCRDACLATWRQYQPQAERLAAAGQWRNLAVLVERVGYQDDLSLYYLGRAAEGLDYSPAAASFYRQSLQLSSTSASCTDLSKLCGGVVLPREASLRLAAIDRALGQPGTRRPARPPTASPAAPVASEALPTPVETAAPVAIVPPSATAPPSATTIPQSAPADTTDYIEPPPAPTPR
jgi:hypothetical protein